VNVYRFYRDLISFRQKGDPAVMLRCINPVESRLIDSAAGIHVKFRLAGVTLDKSFKSYNRLGNFRLFISLLVSKLL